MHAEAKSEFPSAIDQSCNITNNPSCPFHQTIPQGMSSKKGKKQSMPLQSLNKTVLMWAAFFAASLFVYFKLSNGYFSVLVTYGAMARMFGLGILNVRTFSSQRATGVSIKTLQLYCLVFVCRLTATVRHQGYLPYDKTGDWLYHAIEFLGARAHW